MLLWEYIFKLLKFYKLWHCTRLNKKMLTVIKKAILYKYIERKQFDIKRDK